MLIFWGGLPRGIPDQIALFEQRWNSQISVPPAVRIAGLVLLILTSALGVWAAIVMSARGAGTPLPAAMPRKLVTSGPYRYVRNPMAVAGIAQGVSVGLLLGSWLVVLYALIGSLAWNWLVRPSEEGDLAARFGTDYTEYRARVRCWIPRIPR